MSVWLFGYFLFGLGVGIIAYRVFGWNAVAVLLMAWGALLMLVQNAENSR